jgi:hypothetical protein
MVVFPAASRPTCGWREGVVIGERKERVRRKERVESLSLLAAIDADARRQKEEKKTAAKKREGPFLPLRHAPLLAAFPSPFGARRLQDVLYERAAEEGVQTGEKREGAPPFFFREEEGEERTPDGCPSSSPPPQRPSSTTATLERSQDALCFGNLLGTLGSFHERGRHQASLARAHAWLKAPGEEERRRGRSGGAKR